MIYYGYFDSNPDSKTYDQVLNVARIQEEPLVSQRWDPKLKTWVDDFDVYWMVKGIRDGSNYREITEGQALQVAV